MRQGGKKKLRICLWLTAVAVMLGGLYCTAIYYADKLQAEYAAAMQEKDMLLQQNTRQVYVAVRDICAGECIEAEMVELRRTLCSQTDELLFSEQDIGKEAVAPIRAGTFLNKALVNQSGDVEGLREMCYRTIDLTGNIADYDVVDIRIRYPDGEDYVVLAGKQIRLDEEAGDRCYLRVSEEELILMSAALVDVEQNNGTRIYTSKYPEPAIQEKSFVTYRPPEAIMELLEQSPNVRCEASELQSEEQRIGEESDESF